MKSRRFQRRRMAEEFEEERPAERMLRQRKATEAERVLCLLSEIEHGRQLERSASK
jgi:hypothetical protein